MKQEVLYPVHRGIRKENMLSSENLDLQAKFIGLGMLHLLLNATVFCLNIIYILRPYM